MGAPTLPMPPWFERFLKAAFYVPCAVHRNNRKWCNLYCTDCMTPVCSDCRDDEGSHCRSHNHLILQVVRSSYQAAVQIDGANGIGKLFDGEDDIQVYRANRVRIFYLHSRGPSRAENGRASPYQCEACSWPLLDSDKRYCSISCKLMPAEQSNRLHHKHQDGDPSFATPHVVGSDSDDASREHSNSSLSNTISDEQGKGDKRKAKCPRRSPLF
ncbi:hypothetical protein Taro_006295 [Colocasia esculenta]|uniref:B box-type domain-containing protein n=1 Tax=Colocasia esculenta TaxID=4460 RepID=A0A843TWM6_COLES|nr:hypothetical protein [Colocasia esculenta]